MSTLKTPTPTRAGEKLAGRVAFVTGGTRGIGAAICRSLASQGATVAAGYHSDAERARQLCEELQGYDVEASAHQGNVGSAEDCRRTVGEVIERHGRLDILVNNAGITSDKTVLNLTDEDWYKVIAVNLSGAFFVNTVTPGYVATEMVETVPEKVMDRIKGQIPLGRLGEPEEIARVVHFLAGDASGYITGQVWGVNGGMDM